MTEFCNLFKSIIILWTQYNNIATIAYLIYITACPFLQKMPKKCNRFNHGGLAEILPKLAMNKLIFILSTCSEFWFWFCKIVQNLLGQGNSVLWRLTSFILYALVATITFFMIAVILSEKTAVFLLLRTIKNFTTCAFSGYAFDAQEPWHRS